MMQNPDFQNDLECPFWETCIIFPLLAHHDPCWPGQLVWVVMAFSNITDPSLLGVKIKWAPKVSLSQSCITTILGCFGLQFKWPLMILTTEITKWCQKFKTYPKMVNTYKNSHFSYSSQRALQIILKFKIMHQLIILIVQKRLKGG